MNNKTDIEKDILIAEDLIIHFKQTDNEEYETAEAIENILKDRERLIKDNNEKDKKIKAMSFIENTSKYEDTILIDEDRINSTRKRKFLIELNNGEFVEVNSLKEKANKYDGLVEKIKNDLTKSQEEYEILLEHQSGQESNRTKYLRGKIHMCQELLDKEKSNK